MPTSVDIARAVLSFGAYNETDNTEQVLWLLAICCLFYNFVTTVQVMNVRCVRAQAETDVLSKGRFVPPKGLGESTLRHTLE